MSDPDESAAPRAHLLDCADRDGDVAEGALWIAVEECGDVDPGPSLAVLDELAGELRTRCGGIPHGPATATAIPVVAGLLRDRVHLHGGGGDDPFCHYLHTVLARGAGIPIACSAIWIAVGRRAGLRVEGVGLPGHFVVRVGSTLVDAFAGGELLDDPGLRRILTRAVGSEPAEVPEEWLRPVSTREVLARMSRNLRACHSARGDRRRALLAAGRCVALLPDSAVERRERGLLLARIGAGAAALADLRAYLEAIDDAPDRDAVEKLVAHLRATVN